jgi:hypothetical protein
VRLDWRRVVVYTHRWLGIAGCLLFIAWFVSGIVLMYARMPELPDADRRLFAQPIDLSSARIGIADAVRAESIQPQRVRIVMAEGRPVYGLFARGRWTSIFADTGDVRPEPTDAEAQARALHAVQRARPADASTARVDGYLTLPDQWTFGNQRDLPLSRVAVDDSAGTVYYFAAATGEPVMRTTASERRWAYAGAVLHWLYFTPFRRMSALWAQTVIYTSLAGCVLCLSGLVWGIWRLSLSSRYRLKRVRSHTPYAHWMRWHHYAGLVFGLTTFTWIFSGMLSMDPWDWHPDNSPTAAERDAMSGGAFHVEPLTLDSTRTAAALLAASGPAPNEIEVLQFEGKPYYRAEGSLVPAEHPEAGRFNAFERATVERAVERAMSDVPVQDAAWLDGYDAYYYDRHGELPLPVLRVRYLDPQRTWVYADPSRGAIVLKEERLSRLNRWLYHGLHSLDFPFLYYRRPLWDIVVIVLSLGGIASAVTIIVPGVRRLRRGARRIW